MPDLFSIGAKILGGLGRRRAAGPLVAFALPTFAAFLAGWILDSGLPKPWREIWLGLATVILVLGILRLSQFTGAALDKYRRRRT